MAEPNESLAEISILQDPSSLSTDDLVEEYGKISGQYLKTKKIIESYRQQVYQLQRAQKLGLMRENDLKEELNIIADTHTDDLANEKKKSHTEMSEMRDRINDLKAIRESLETEIVELKASAGRVQPMPDIETKPCDPNETIVESSRLESLIELEAKFATITEENAMLRSKMSGLEANAARFETKFGDLNERLECAQENLASKSSELEEIKQITENQQERIFELEAELANFRSGTVDHGKKGNSLFAEVDDQRQAMRHDMKSMRDKYVFMKKKYTESETEIRRLRRENADIHDEIKQSVSMFRQADTVDKHQMSERIGFLTREHTRLQSRLEITETKLYEAARKHDAVWLQSMWEHNKKECEELRKENYSYSVGKSHSDHCYSESQRSAARWRFEALKNRCIIIDRDLLLEANNIPYEAQLKNARKVVTEKFGDGSGEQPSIDNIIPITPGPDVICLEDTVQRSMISLCNDSVATIGQAAGGFETRIAKTEPVEADFEVIAPIKISEASTVSNDETVGADDTTIVAAEAIEGVDGTFLFDDTIEINRTTVVGTEAMEGADLTISNVETVSSDDRTTTHTEATAGDSTVTEVFKTTNLDSYEESSFEVSAIADSTLLAMANPVEMSILMNESEYDAIPGILRPQNKETMSNTNMLSSTLLDGEFKRPGTPNESIISVPMPSNKGASSLANELAAIQPQYRSIDRKTERTRALREISENANDSSESSNSNLSAGANSSKYRIIQQRPRKSKIIVRSMHFGNRNNSTSNENNSTK